MAAFALEEALRAEGFLPSCLEVAADHHPWAGKAVARAYHRVIRQSPWIWGRLHRSGVTRRALKSLRRAYLSFGGGAKIRRRIDRDAPLAIICPQATIAAVLCEARRRGELPVPVVSVLTDFTVDPFWGEPFPDFFIAPNESAADELNAMGVPRDRISVCGIPIHSAYRQAPERRAVRQALGLPISAPIILLSGGTKGLGGIDRTAEAILEECPRATILALCGADDSLRRAMVTRGGGEARFRVYGPQPPTSVAALMSASDIHVGKPGGVTTAESLAMGLPMIFTRPIPGQEEANARHLVARGAALRADNYRSAATLAALLMKDPQRLDRLRLRAASQGRPMAARDAAIAVRHCLTRGAQTGKINQCPIN